MRYKAFLSYSHATGGKLVPAIQRALNRFAKPWYRLRAMRTFRDKTSLSVTPKLWSSIQKALIESEYFILFASPASAASMWVQREVEFWLSHHPPEKLLILLTEGEIYWEKKTNDFDWTRTDAVPRNLESVFDEEPLYLDIRWACKDEDISISNARFRDIVADLAATIQARPKDELIGEDVQQHRKTKRLAWSAGISLLVLTGAALGGLLLAEIQRTKAESGRLAAQARSLLSDHLPLSLLLSLEALKARDTPMARGILLDGLTHNPGLLSFLHRDSGRGKVFSVSFSPNGKYLASGTHSGYVELWSLTERSLVATGRICDWGGAPNACDDKHSLESNDKVSSVAFSPDGAILASGDYHGSIVLWRLPDLSPIAGPLQGHEDDIFSLAFSPIGNTLASGSRDGRIILFDVSSHTRLKPSLNIHHGMVEDLAFNSSGDKLASASLDGTVILWDVQSKQAVAAFPDPTKEFHSVTNMTSFHERLAAAMDARGQETLRLAKLHLRLPKNQFHSISFSDDGSVLATGSDRGLMLWKVSTEEIIEDEIKWHPHNSLRQGGVKRASSRVNLVRFSSIGEFLASAANNGTTLWDIGSSRIVGKASPKASAFSGSLRNFASKTNESDAIGLWSLEWPHRLGELLTVDNGSWSTVAFSHDGRLLAAGSGKLSPNDESDVVQIWDTETKELLHKLEIDGYVDQMIFELVAGESILVYTTRSGKSVSWSVQQRRPVQTMVRCGGRVAFSPKSPILACGGLNTGPVGVTFWDLSSEFGETKPAHSNAVSDITFSPDGRWLATSSFDGTVLIWSVDERSPSKPLMGHSRNLQGGYGPISAIAFSPDSRVLATSGYDGDVILWDVETQKRLINQLRGLERGSDLSSPATEATKSLAFSHDGNTLALGTYGGSILLWDVESRTHIGILNGHTSWVNALAFSPDDQKLASTGHDSRVILWNLDLDSWKRQACMTANRNLNKDEWTQFFGNKRYEQTCPDLLPG